MGRAAMRTAIATVAAGALIALAGCGSSSKPAYCSDRTNLENSVKNLPSVTSSSGVSGLKSQINTIVSDANAVVSSAKSDFPSQTSAVKTSVDALQSAVKALPSQSFSQSDRRDRDSMRPKRRELGQELLGRQQVEVQLTRQSAMAGRSACRLLAWPSARHPCSSVGAARPVGRARWGPRARPGPRESSPMTNVLDRLERVRLEVLSVLEPCSEKMVKRPTVMPGLPGRGCSVRFPGRGV